MSRKRNADFWRSANTYDLDEAYEMVTLRQSVSNFVKIMTGLDIPVYFEGETSYTDFEHIVIALVEDIDVTVGLCLHESCHIILTDPIFFKELDHCIKKLNLGPVPKKDLYLVKDLLNWIEDRRIDEYCYKNAVGYQGYYDALYNYYFYSEAIANLLDDKSFCRLQDWNSYMFRIINLINPKADVEALPGLREIWNTLDLANIERLQDTEDALHLAIDIYRIVKKFIKKQTQQKAEKSTTTVENRKETRKAQKLLKDQRHFIRRTVRTSGISEKLLDELERYEVPKSIVGTTSTIEDRSFTVIEKLSPEHIHANKWSFFRFQAPILVSTYRSAIERGFLMGNRLLTQLRVMSEVDSVKFHRQSTGKLDSSALYLAGIESSRIFYQAYSQPKHKPIHLFLLLDYSGSMLQGEKALKVLQLAAALVRVSKSISQIRLTIVCGIAEYMVYAFDSQVDSEHWFKTLMPHIGFIGNGSFEDVHLELMLPKLKTANDRTVYVLNVSDGQPSLLGAPIRIKQVMSQLYKKDINLLSYFIYESTEVSADVEKAKCTFRSMYGRCASFIEVERIAEIANTLNRLMLGSL